MLASLLLAVSAHATVGLGPAPLLAAHYHYYSPGGDTTAQVDTSWALFSDTFGVVWHRGGGGGSQVCFSSASGTGGPSSPPIVLDSIEDDALLTAGPVVCTVGGLRDFLVAWALNDADGTPIVRAAWLRSTDGGVWYVEKEDTQPLLDFGPGDFVDGIDVGGTRVARQAQIALTIAGDLVDVGVSIDAGFSDSFQLFEPRVFASPDGTFWRNPSLAAHGTHFTAFEVWKSGVRSIAGTDLSAFEPEVFVLLAGDEHVRFTDPSLGGYGFDLALAARATEEGGVAIVTELVTLDHVTDVPDPAEHIELVAFPAGTELRGPALGQAGGERYFVTWKVAQEEGWLIEGVGLQLESLEPCEDPFPIAQDWHPTSPRVSDSRYALSATALVVWGGAQPGLPGAETRGALVRACEQD